MSRVEGGVVPPPTHLLCEQRALNLRADMKGPHKQPEDWTYVTCLWLSPVTAAWKGCRECERERVIRIESEKRGAGYKLGKVEE